MPTGNPLRTLLLLGALICPGALPPRLRDRMARLMHEAWAEPDAMVGAPGVHLPPFDRPSAWWAVPRFDDSGRPAGRPF